MAEYKYTKKGSKVSLRNSLVCGSLLIGGGVIMGMDNNYFLVGLGLAAGTSSLVTMRMVRRFLHTTNTGIEKFMYGVLAALAATSMAYHFIFVAFFVHLFSGKFELPPLPLMALGLFL